MLPLAFLASLLLGVDVVCGKNTKCSLNAHINEADASWIYPHDKDPYGNNATHSPLPNVSPFNKISEAEINKQINRELFAHYTYLSMAMHFNRDDINLPGFHKFFLESAEEEMKHAQKFMKYQNMRGGRVKLHHIMKPYENHWGNGLGAMTHAYHLELEVYQALIDIHKNASDDPQFQDFLESEFLGEQVESIKELSNYINTLKRFSEQNYALGEYQFDKITLRGESKE